MKTLKLLLTLVIFTFFACSKQDDAAPTEQPAPPTAPAVNVGNLSTTAPVFNFTYKKRKSKVEN